ncbi:MAG: type ISP restriction/modification enzyme [Anaerolineae bacterium]
MSDADAFKTYLRDLRSNLTGGMATEHTHRPALKHLLESLEPVRGDNRVVRVRYVPSGQDAAGHSTPGRVMINETQYFGGVPPEVWAFHIGGYQVLEK